MALQISILNRIWRFRALYSLNWKKKRSICELLLVYLLLCSIDVFLFLHIGQKFEWNCRFIIWIITVFEGSDYNRRCARSCSHLIYAEYLSNRRKYIENRRQNFWHLQKRHLSWKNKACKCKQTNKNSKKKKKMIFIKSIQERKKWQKNQHRRICLEMFGV